MSPTRNLPWVLLFCMQTYIDPKRGGEMNQFLEGGSLAKSEEKQKHIYGYRFIVYIYTNKRCLPSHNFNGLLPVVVREQKDL